MNWMFRSMLFTTANNIFILAAWVDVQYRNSWLPLYNKKHSTHNL